MRSLIAFPVLSLSLAACTADSLIDELAVDSDDSAVDGKADGTPGGAYTYFAIHGDKDGFSLARLNRSTTECQDGSVAAACRAPELDWVEASLADATRGQLIEAARSGDHAAIVRGRFAPGRFIVTEAWVNPTGAEPAGVFAKVATTPVVCISSPCENLIERGLNSSNHAMIADVDWAGAQLAPELVDLAHAALAQPSGVIVAGDRYQVEDHGRTARGRTASAVFFKLADAAAN